VTYLVIEELFVPRKRPLGNLEREAALLLLTEDGIDADRLALCDVVVVVASGEGERERV